MKKVLVLLGLALAVFIAWFVIADPAGLDEPEPQKNQQDRNRSEQKDQNKQQTAQFDKMRYSLSEPGSIWLVVNKQRPISTEYAPNDLRDVNVNKRGDKSKEELMLRQTAASSLEQLFSDAKKDGMDLLLGSAYRSAELQRMYYQNYVAAYGQEEADKFSARPGTSEHQTGLAADVSGADRTCYLEICFAEQPAGEWVAEHAYEYGFIIRYPQGKQSITGYQYEPWHLRYVGQALAQQLHQKDLTMEEFFSERLSDQSS